MEIQLENNLTPDELLSLKWHTDNYPNSLVNIEITEYEVWVTVGGHIVVDRATYKAMLTQFHLSSLVSSNIVSQST